jgi:cation diffusion facilitator CzcD-associated flavoprotein CzcO
MNAQFRVQRSPVDESTRRNHAAHMPGIPDRCSLEDFKGEKSHLLPTTMAELELMVRRELDLTRYPAKSWVIPRSAPDGTAALDSLIVGGGQAGISAAFALMQQRIQNIQVIDANAPDKEGPWGTFARMPTLRTHKDVGGIELGIPSLSFRAWYEVQYGPNSWDDLYKVPTDLWHNYLRWYREILDLPVRNHCRLVKFEPMDNGLLAVEVECSSGTREILFARTLVLATGAEGNGQRHVPEFVVANVPREYWNHSQDDIGFEALSGKTVAVLGGGASAFDNAIMAAEHGAAAVHIFHRQAALTSINPGTWSEYSGYLAHFPDLSPAERWRFVRQGGRIKGGPPKWTLQRAASLPNLTVHAATHWKSVGMQGNRIQLDATDGPLTADHLILGTGYMLDMSVRSEFAAHLSKIALWRDRFTPPEADVNSRLLDAPFLGSHFEMQEKNIGEAPWLARVFNFARGAQMSMGVMPIGLSGIKFGLPRLAGGVARALFTQDAEDYLEGLSAWQDSDLSVIDT